MSGSYVRTGAGSALERAAGPAEQLAGADREQRAVLGPYPALATDQPAGAAGRLCLDEEPGLVGSPAVEGNRQVDARRDVVVPHVVTARGRPAERVEQDYRAARIDPRV